MAKTRRNPSQRCRHRRNEAPAPRKESARSIHSPLIDPGRGSSGRGREAEHRAAEKKRASRVIDQHQSKINTTLTPISLFSLASLLSMALFSNNDRVTFNEPARHLAFPAGRQFLAPA